MNYAEQQRQVRKHPTGLIVVALLHIVLGWALVNGLGRKLVEVMKAPLETRLIDEIKPPPPPPPPENLPPPPKTALPPPSFMPPPEVQLATPQQAPAITVTREAPPPVPVTMSPAAPAAAAAPAAPAPRPQAVAARIDVSSCEKPEYPPAALRADASGTSKIRFTIDASGTVAKAEIERAAGSTREHRLLDRAAIEALSKCRFKPGMDETGKPTGGSTVVDYVWRTD